MIVIGVLLLLGSYLVVENCINIGQFVVVEIVVILILNLVEKLILFMEIIYDVFIVVEKIGVVIDFFLEVFSGIVFDQIDSGEGMEVKIE